MKRALGCILVVDDSEDHRYITATELRKLRPAEEVPIREATRGDEALAALPSLIADFGHVLVVSDYRMPNMGGLELLRLARSQFPEANLRFVLYSSTDLGVGEQARLSGADVFLVKPMDLHVFRKELHGIVGEWLRHVGAGAAKRRS